MPQPDVKPSFLAFALPAAMGVLLTLAVGGLAIAGWIGREPEGERLTVTFTSDCAAQWESVVAARVSDIGLGDPELHTEGEHLVLTATFPGLDDDREAIPALLIQPGTLAVYAAGEDGGPTGEVLATERDITSVALQLDLRVRALVEVTLEQEARDRVHEASRAGPVVYLIDGEVVETWDDRRGLKGMNIDLQPERETLAQEIRAATDWSIILRSGPGPCPAQVTAIRAAES